MSEKLFHEEFLVVDDLGVHLNAVSRIDSDTNEVDVHLRDGREIRTVDETDLRYEIVRTGEALRRVS